ncbi:MAG TPA: lysophospholipase [Candidatus Limnocylindrales bacterium]|nr:lysophospholipase [Candidatus Limnocylindrales bacterium]
MPSTVTHRPAPDGTPLVARHWAPMGVAWARLLLVHGLAEHSGRYEHVGERLAAAGIDAHAIDLRGFGASGGERAWVDRWSRLHDDLEHRIEWLRTLEPAVPLVLYGHSLGGLVCLGYALDARAEPDLLVLSAPAIDSAIPAWRRLLATVLNRIAPSTRVANSLRSDSLSRDPAVWADYLADPLNEHRSTVRLGTAAIAEQQRVTRRLHDLAIPTLVIHGGDDQLVPTASSQAFEGRRGVTRRVYPGARHEVHNETERDQVIDDVVAWIREQV